MLGMLFGIEGYTTSLRFDSEHSFVMDDLFYLSPCHLLTMPKEYIIPDWLHLLNDPVKAIPLLEQLKADAYTVLKSDFFSDEDWRTQTYGDIDEAEFEAEFFESVIYGFKYPPSQKQLHLQSIAAPFTPQQHHKFMTGGHFTKTRWFSYEYVLDAVEAVETYNLNEADNGRQPFKLNPDQTIDKLILWLDGLIALQHPLDVPEYAQNCQATYSANWDAEMERMKTQSTKYQMGSDKFLYQVVKGVVLNKNGTPLQKAIDMKGLISRDQGSFPYSLGSRAVVQAVDGTYEFDNTQYLQHPRAPVVWNAKGTEVVMRAESDIDDLQGVTLWEGVEY